MDLECGRFGKDVMDGCKEFHNYAAENLIKC